MNERNNEKGMLYIIKRIMSFSSSYLAPFMGLQIMYLSIDDNKNDYAFYFFPHAIMRWRNNTGDS